MQTKTKPNNIKEVMAWIGSHTSEAKKKSSKLNGLKPCREGKKRGRPRNDPAKH